MNVVYFKMGSKSAKPYKYHSGGDGEWKRWGRR